MQITTVESPPIPLSIRKERQLNKMTMGFVALRWRDKYLKGHFARTARGKYSYRKRSSKWNRRKRRLAQRGNKVKKGGRVDLVASGLMERLVTSLHQFRIFPTRATHIMQAPSYVRKRPRGNRPDMGAEVTAVSPVELRDLDTSAATFAERAREKLRSKKRRTYKGS